MMSDWTDLLCQFDVYDRADALVHQTTGNYRKFEWARTPGGASGGEIERELARVGVGICGRWFSPASEEHPHGTLSLLVHERQARWAEYVLSAFGIQFVSEPVDARSMAAATARQGRRIPAWSERSRAVDSAIRFQSRESESRTVVERLKSWLFEGG